MDRATYGLFLGNISVVLVEKDTVMIEGGIWMGRDKQVVIFPSVPDLTE